MKRQNTKLFGKKMVATLLAIQLSAVSMLTGCGTTETTKDTITAETAKSNVLMTIEDFEATQQLYNLYVIQYMYSNKTEPLALDEKGIEELQTSVVNEMKSEIVQYLLAQITEGVEVTDQAEATSKASCTAMYNFFGEDFLAKYGVDYDCITALFERQAYISALKDKAIADMQETYKEQYLEKYGDLNFHSLYYALFPSIKYDEEGNAVKKGDGSYEALSKKEMDEQLAKATELMERAQAGEKMEDLVAEYGIEDYSGAERNYEGAYSSELNEVVASLSANDISDVVKTEAGYMVVRMDMENDPEYKDYMINSLAVQTADNNFPNLQANWLVAAGTDKIEPNQEILDALDIVELGKAMQKKGFY